MQGVGGSEKACLGALVECPATCTPLPPAQSPPSPPPPTHRHPARLRGDYILQNCRRWVTWCKEKGQACESTAGGRRGCLLLCLLLRCPAAMDGHQPTHLSCPIPLHCTAYGSQVERQLPALEAEIAKLRA